MDFIKKNYKGLLLCLVIAVPSWFLGKAFPIIGGAVIGIIAGMIITLFIKDKSSFESGIKFASKKILQWAVILLGFGMNLSVILQTGKTSFPIIVCTIATSLIIAFVLSKVMHIPGKISTLVGVGSSICGGSAIAATAPVIKANDEEIGQAISVVFFFNVVAALVFPTLGDIIGMSHDAVAYGKLAGTAVNDTSSVTAAASTWDSMFSLGHDTLDKAVTVKLTRTLAIIPIVLCLSVWYAKRHNVSEQERVSRLKIINLVPSFIIMFIIAALITTIAVYYGVDASVFRPFKDVSLFFIIMAMAAIGLNCNIVKLIKTGFMPIMLGLACWLSITAVCLVIQYEINIW